MIAGLQLGDIPDAEALIEAILDEVEAEHVDLRRKVSEAEYQADEYRRERDELVALKSSNE